MTVWLDSVGVLGPGLLGWDAAREVLAGVRPYCDEPLPAPRTTLLAANERRRTTPVIRLALQAAEDALGHASLPAAQLGSVFASSSGDMEIVDRICTALCLPERPVSPTQFHNSVHNAPAGYWTLGASVRMPSTSIAAAGRTFAAGLLEAWTLVAVERQPVLLVAYDWPAPPTLQPHRPLAAPFATALVLRPEAGADPGPRIDLQLQAGAFDTLQDPALEALRNGNPAACALPLLAVVAGGESAGVSLPYSETQVLTVQCRQA